MSAAQARVNEFLASVDTQSTTGGGIVPGLRRSDLQDVLRELSELQEMRDNISLVVGGQPLPPHSSPIWMRRALKAEEELSELRVISTDVSGSFALSDALWDIVGDEASGLYTDIVWEDCINLARRLTKKGFRKVTK